MGTRTMNRRGLRRAAGGLIAAAGLVVACTDSPTDAAPTYTVGGTVSGLAGTGLVLRDNGGDDLIVTSDGSFTFATRLADGEAYHIAVANQPTSPWQSCFVTTGSGTVAAGNVTTVTIDCKTNRYTLGGTVSGLVGSGFVLRDNGYDDLAVSANGTFIFATPVASGTRYAVTVASQPAAPSQYCRFSFPFSGNTYVGTVADADIMGVIIACVGYGTLQVIAATTGTNAPATYTVLRAESGGTYGLLGQVPTNGMVSFQKPAGGYSVRLLLPTNCTLPAHATNPHSVNVTSGGTASTTFNVVCQ